MNATEKQYRAKIKNLGGTIDGGLGVEWPEIFRLKTKRDAIDILDVLIQDTGLENYYTIDLDEPLIALKRFIKSAGALK